MSGVGYVHPSRHQKPPKSHPASAVIPATYRAEPPNRHPDSTQNHPIVRARSHNTTHNTQTERGSV